MNGIINSEKPNLLFTYQLEKSREAVDLANIRAGYAEVMTAALTSDDTAASVDANGEGLAHTAKTTVWTYTVKLEQTQEGWQSTVDTVGGYTISDKTPKKGGTATVTYDSSKTDGSNLEISFS